MGVTSRERARILWVLPLLPALAPYASADCPVQAVAQCQEVTLFNQRQCIDLIVDVRGRCQHESDQIRDLLGSDRVQDPNALKEIRHRAAQLMSELKEFEDRISKIRPPPSVPFVSDSSQFRSIVEDQRKIVGQAVARLDAIVKQDAARPAEGQGAGGRDRKPAGGGGFGPWDAARRMGEEAARLAKDKLSKPDVPAPQKEQLVGALYPLDTAPPGAAQDPEVVRAYQDLGSGYLLAGKPEDAQRVLSRYLEFNPRDSKARGLLSSARLQRQDYRGALEDARAALELDPTDKTARDVYDFVTKARHDIRLGKRLLKPEFGALGGDASVAAVRAAPEPQARANAGAPDVSEAAVLSGGAALGGSLPVMGGTVVARDRTPSQVLAAKAYELLTVGKNPEGALFEVTRALDADPKNASARVLRAYISNQFHNYAGALSDAREALKIEPANAAALRIKAYAHYQLKQYDQALEAASESIRLEPDNGAGYLYRAMAEEKLGLFRQALADYETASAKSPALKPLWDQAVSRLKGERPAGADAGTPSPAPPSRWRSAGFRILAGLAAMALLWIGARGLAARTGRRAASWEDAEAGQAAPEAARPRAETLPAGAVVGQNFRIERVIGRGGMGVVYEAYDTALDRRVAIKQLRTPEASADDRERFLREARLVAQLRHPNVLEIHTVIEEGGEYHLVFEFVEGRTLESLLGERRELPLEDARRLLKDICGALEYAHSKRIIHRDLKPSNVMVTKEGSCKVMDFGIAHQARTLSRETQTAPWGTPQYMAPEQETGRVSKESDLYALAVMTYEMLTGSRPFPGPDYYETKRKRAYAPASRLNGKLPPAIDAFFDKALQPEPESRFRTSKEFLDGFEKLSQAKVPQG